MDFYSSVQKRSKTALFVFSGKFLERPFAMDALEGIRNGVERALSERDVILTRSVATLNGDRQLLAPFFLAAGFETIAADDEDAQAVSIIWQEIASLTPPDEVVLIMGIDEPITILRPLGGRTRRVLLRLSDPGSDPGVSYNLGQCLEGLLDIRELLSKEGVNWNQLELRSWEGLADVYAELIGGASSSPAEPARVFAPQPLAKPSSEPSLEPLASESERETVDELARLKEVIDGFAKSAPEWNKALIDLLSDRELKCSAFKATEQLDERFSGLNSFYMNYRDEFEKLLCPDVRLIQDENSGTFLCHIDHPDLAPIGASEGVSQLTIGGGALESNEPTPTVVSLPDAQRLNFADVARHVDLLREQSLWSVERDRRSNFGSSYETDIKPTDTDLRDRASAQGVYMWQIRPDVVCSQEQFLKTADAYELLSNSLRLMQNAANSRDRLSSDFISRYMQLAANAQCLMKTTLTSVGVDFKYDQAQREAFEVLSDFRTKYYKNVKLDNLRFIDQVQFDRLPELTEEYRVLKDELSERLIWTKERRNCENKLNYNLDQVKKTPGSVNNWNNVVNAVTELIEKFGEQPSSLWLRGLLSDAIDNIPDEVERTDEFCLVVQQIESIKALEDYELEQEFKFAAADDFTYEPDVLAVRARYGGKKAVFIGGTPQDHLRGRIEEQFNVELYWEETDHGDSLDRMTPYLNDPDVMLFIIYIPWCSHKHSEEFAKIAKGDYGKDFVRVRKGTNPNQIAKAICEQITMTPADER